MKRSREIYITPHLEVIEIQLEGMVASSLDIREDVTISGPGRSKQRLWDTEH